MTTRSRTPAPCSASAVESAFRTQMTQSGLVECSSRDPGRGGSADVDWNGFDWLLVECKPDYETIHLERAQYLSHGALNQYTLLLLDDLANVRAVRAPEPHYVVYPTPAKEPELRLQARRYWDDWIEQYIFAIARCPKQNLHDDPILGGVDQGKFNRYLNLLLTARLNGGGPIPAVVPGLVVAISKAGDRVMFLTLAEYIRATGFALLPLPEHLQVLLGNYSFIHQMLCVTA